MSIYRINESDTLLLKYRPAHLFKSKRLTRRCCYFPFILSAITHAVFSLHLLSRKIRLLSENCPSHSITQHMSAFHRWLAPFERHFTGHSKTVLRHSKTVYKSRQQTVRPETQPLRTLIPGGRQQTTVSGARLQAPLPAAI